MEIKLRQLKKSDFEEHWKLISNKTVAKYLTWEVYTDREKAMEFHKKAMRKVKYPDKFLAIIYKERLIGTIHIVERTRGNIQFGFSILPKYKKNELDVRAVGLILSDLLTKEEYTEWFCHGKATIWLDLNEKNQRSIRIANELGFELGVKGIESKRDRYIKRIYLPDVRMQYLKAKVIKHFERDRRINQIFVTGSSVNNQENIFSDVDLWFVVTEESDMNKIIEDMPMPFNEFDKLLNWYNVTLTHYFLTFESGTIFDINFCTAAAYFSILSTSKKVVFSKTAPSETREVFSGLMIRGINGAKRILSKVKKGEYYVAPRFMNSLREDVVLPLLKSVKGITYLNKVNFSLDPLNDYEKELFKNLYITPEQESIRTGVVSLLRLFRIILDDENTKQLVNHYHLKFIKDSISKIHDEEKLSI